MKNIKCTFIGEGAIGKTSLIRTYKYGSFQTEYSPTIIDNVYSNIMYENQPIKLNIQDLAGQEELDTLLDYVIPNTDVFIFCFSLVDPYSLKNLQKLWLPKIKDKGPEISYILVGLKSDLRDDFIQSQNVNKYEYMKPILTFEGEKMSKKINALDYIECSSLKYYHVHDVFISAIKQALIHKNSKFNNSNKNEKSKCKIC